MKTHFKLSAFEKVKRIRLIVTVVGLLCALQGVARDREQVWPSGKMPDAQEHQIAAMTDETSDSKFKPEKHRIAYLEWFEKPDPAVANGCCMILISGGSYENCIKTAMIAVQSYAESMYEAARLNEDVKTAMLSMAALNDICKVNLNSDYNYTDTEQKKYRYQAIFDVTYY